MIPPPRPGELPAPERRQRLIRSAQALARTIEAAEARRCLDDLVRAERVRPSALLPVWQRLGHGLGAASQAAGPRVAALSREAAAEALDEHLAQGASVLDGADAVCSAAASIRPATTDEAAPGAAEEMLQQAVKLGCRAVLWLSGRL